MARAALRCLLMWLGFLLPGWPIDAALAQDTMTCGNLYFRATADAGQNSWFGFQVFRRVNGEESPVLPGSPWGSVPRASCIEGSALAVTYFYANGDPVVQLVFQNGGHTSSFLSLGDYEVRGDIIVLPARPRLPQEIRERIPAEYRGLFDYGPLKGKFG